MNAQLHTAASFSKGKSFGNKFSMRRVGLTAGLDEEKYRRGPRVHTRPDAPCTARIKCLLPFTMFVGVKFIICIPDMHE